MAILHRIISFEPERQPEVDDEKFDGLLEHVFGLRMPDSNAVGSPYASMETPANTESEKAEKP